MSYSPESGSDQEDCCIDKSHPYPYSKDEFGTGIYFNLNKRVECRVHPSPIIGKGLFAKEDIKQGDFIWYEDKEQMYTELISVDEMEVLRRTNPDKFDYYVRYAFQIDFTHLVVGEAESDASFYMNHSCDPNCWFSGENLILARRDIQKGEELTYDYATTETMYIDFTACMCGAKTCRQNISTRDWQIPELQERYGRHFLPYILHALDAQRGVSQ